MYPALSEANWGIVSKWGGCVNEFLKIFGHKDTKTLRPLSVADGYEQKAQYSMFNTQFSSLPSLKIEN